MNRRKTKERLARHLAEDNFTDLPDSLLSGLSLMQIVNMLFSLLFHDKELVRWRAVSLMGITVSKLAESDMESARRVMRRLIWNLNDESGGIGWGSPEAMGEIIAGHERLASEYHNILISYIMPHGNFIEHEMLQRGVLWGIGRAAQSRPELVKETGAERYLFPYIDSGDTCLKGLALAALAFIDFDGHKAFLEKFREDSSILPFYINHHLVFVSIGEIASGRLLHDGQTGV